MGGIDVLQTFLVTLLQDILHDPSRNAECDVSLLADLSEKNTTMNKTGGFHQYRIIVRAINEKNMRTKPRMCLEVKSTRYVSRK
jgi:hypothetical protein